MGSSSLELTLSLKPSYVPKTISNLLSDLSKIDSVSDKLSVLNDYLHKYQEELSRVQDLKRELPQCMLLLMDAIETLKEEIVSVGNSKEPDSGKPLMEFLSMKRKLYESPEERIVSDQYPARKEKGLHIDMNASVDDFHQLWNNPIPDKKQKAILHPTQTLSLTPIQPCKKSITQVPLMAAGGSSGTGSILLPVSAAEKQRGKEPAVANVPPGPGPVAIGGLNLRTDPVTLNYHPEPLTEKIWKNNRRSWSPQLHARFVHALNILGGVQG
ncbi:myb family transcription factor EFM-like [Melia azedarach]|uniref:Myb family transcription factor EFM-like n=1 Tax=Melia azedarach TaxID=155640 RepID=A0ACC1X7G3_MELAZ|nr:myb family transcription factor EFM-like [Melia azedarach]